MVVERWVQGFRRSEGRINPDPINAALHLTFDTVINEAGNGRT